MGAVKKASKQRFTRSNRKQSETEQTRSAISDHVARDNHIINWEGANIIDKETNSKARWVKEAIWIRRNSSKLLNRDEGAYQLSHLYDPVLLKTFDTGDEAAVAGSSQQQHC